jgi:hypothetical protein
VTDKVAEFGMTMLSEDVEENARKPRCRGMRGKTIGDGVNSR